MKNILMPAISVVVTTFLALASLGGLNNQLISSESILVSVFSFAAMLPPIVLLVVFICSIISLYLKGMIW